MIKIVPAAFWCILTTVTQVFLQKPGGKKKVVKIYKETDCPSYNTIIPQPKLPHKSNTAT